MRETDSHTVLLKLNMAIMIYMMTQVNLSGKTCLVTGASGFIGGKLCHALSKQGATVRVLLHSEQKTNWNQSFTCNLGAQKVPDQVMCGVDIVFHLAGRTHSLSDTNSQDSLYFMTNVDGTRSLLEAANKENIKQFIFFSSVKSMGEENDNRLDETFTTNPVSVYGKSKKEAEDLVLNGEYVPHATVLRLAMVYGDTKKGNLVKMIEAIYANRFPPLPNIENKRSMIHVEDVVQATLLAATNNVSAGKLYILSDGIDYSTGKIYQTILQSLGKEKSTWSVPLIILQLIAKTGDFTKLIFGRRAIFDSDNLQKLIGNSFFSVKKAKKELGFVPKRNLYREIHEIISKLDLK